MSGRRVAIIGAGAAGRSAAVSAAGFGLEVLLFEQFSVSSDWAGIQAPHDVGSIQVFDRTPVWGLFPSWTVAASRNGQPIAEQVDAVILATGSTDKTLPFSGSSLPGVMTAGGLMRLVDIHRLLPGQRFVVIGDGEYADSVVNCIAGADGDIVLRVSESQARGMVARGAQGVELVELDGRSVDTDIVVIAVGRMPDVTLAAMAECELVFDLIGQSWTVGRNQAFATTSIRVWAAGDVAGSASEEIARSEGRQTAAQAAHWLGCLDSARLDEELAQVANVRSRMGWAGHSVVQPWIPALVPHAWSRTMIDG